MLHLINSEKTSAIFIFLFQRLEFTNFKSADF